jgi:hypothetical protein
MPKLESKKSFEALTPRFFGQGKEGHLELSPDLLLHGQHQRFVHLESMSFNFF